jgi:hypothetical protein
MFLNYDAKIIGRVPKCAVYTIIGQASVCDSWTTGRQSTLALDYLMRDMEDSGIVGPKW